jgi:hypothetical protein
MAGKRNIKTGTSGEENVLTIKLMMMTTIHHTMQSFYQIIIIASISKGILVQTMKGYVGLDI